MNNIASAPFFSKLRPVEKFILLITGALVLLDIFMIIYKSSNVAYLDYARVVTVSIICFIAGFYYRVSGRSEQIATALICTGLLVAFTAALGMYNYLLLPLTLPTIDIYITKIDAMFGYHWPNVMEFAAQFPVIVFIMKLAYASTLFQIAILVIVLGFTGMYRDLDKLMISLSITGIIAVCFWGLFPTLGAKSMYELPNEIWQAVNPPVNKEYALDLIRLAKFGPELITASELRGMIAFPSYHAVLAFIAIYSARNIKYVNVFFLFLNLLILPATFIHGGHHMMDLPGGFAVFLIGIWLTNRLYKKFEKQETKLEPQAA